MEKLPELTYAEMFSLAMQSDYGIEANQPKENPINWADAAMFFNAGYEHFRQRLNEQAANNGDH